MSKLKSNFDILIILFKHSSLEILLIEKFKFKLFKIKSF